MVGLYVRQKIRTNERYLLSVSEPLPPLIGLKSGRREKPLFQAYIAMSPTLSPFMSENLSKNLPEIPLPLFYYMATAAEDFKANRKTILNLNQKLNAQEFKAILYKFDDFEAQNH